MDDWIDNVDSYVCPVCGFECNNPNRFQCKCPKCGFIATKDILSSDVVEVVRCKDCKHYIAEEKERCEAMGQTPYGLCIKHRCLPLAGYYEYRNEDDFCSYGERKDNE